MVLAIAWVNPQRSLGSSQISSRICLFDALVSSSAMVLPSLSHRLLSRSCCHHFRSLFQPRHHHLLGSPRYHVPLHHLHTVLSHKNVSYTRIGHLGLTINKFKQKGQKRCMRHTITIKNLSQRCKMNGRKMCKQSVMRICKSNLFFSELQTDLKVELVVKDISLSHELYDPPQITDIVSSALYSSRKVAVQMWWIISAEVD